MNRRWVSAFVYVLLCACSSGCGSDAGEEPVDDVKLTDASELAGKPDVEGPNDLVDKKDSLPETKDSTPADLAGDLPAVEDVQADQAETVEPEDTTPDVCTPDCSWKQCGNDGCDGSCGECQENFYCGPGFQCIPFDCTPECFAKECGWDGCDGSCGECQAGHECSDAGMCVCVPHCTSKQCGDGGCADHPAACGTCDEGQECLEGKCKVKGGCWPNCGDEVLVPAGSFWMGCNQAVDTQCESDEKPYHEVFLDGYYLDRTEVTVDAYGACVTAGVCTAPGTGSSYCNWDKMGKGDHPVNCISWFQAKQYCEWAGKRLPTEAEWEKGARGGCELNGGAAECQSQSRKYPWGNETATCEYAVMAETTESGCGTDSTMSVCSKSPAGDSPYGLCDMAGNVREWTSDWFDSAYYTISPTNNPTGPSEGSARTLRGGSMHAYHTAIRLAYRYFSAPSEGVDYIGVRCARSE